MLVPSDVKDLSHPAASTNSLPNARLTAPGRHGPIQVIKLSDAIQPLPRAVTQFVHGVAKPFLATGERLAARRGQTLSMAVDESQTRGEPNSGDVSCGITVSASGFRGARGWHSELASLLALPWRGHRPPQHRPPAPTGSGTDARTTDEGSEDGASRSKPLFDKGAYFIGKAVWGKGYSELLERLAEQKAARDGGAIPIDIFGTGEDLGEARSVDCTTCLLSVCLSCHIMLICCSLRARLRRLLNIVLVCRQQHCVGCLHVGYRTCRA